MALQVPQPPQGWAALRWEVGVVFVGIVLALSAQQLADALYWRGQAAQAKRNIEQELMQHEKDAYERLAVQPCLKGQLAALMRQLLASHGDWKAMPMAVNMTGLSQTTQAARRVFPVAYRSPERLWLQDAFETAQANGALNHLSDASVAEYAEIYTRGRTILQLRHQENEAATLLAALAFEAKLAPAARIELMAARGRIDHSNSYIENSARQAVEKLRDVLKDVPAERRRAGIAERLSGQREFRGTCVRDIQFRP